MIYRPLSNAGNGLFLCRKTLILCGFRPFFSHVCERENSMRCILI